MEAIVQPNDQARDAGPLERNVAWLAQRGQWNLVVERDDFLCSNVHRNGPRAWHVCLSTDDVERLLRIARANDALGVRSVEIDHYFEAIDDPSGCAVSTDGQGLRINHVALYAIGYDSADGNDTMEAGLGPEMHVDEFPDEGVYAQEGEEDDPEEDDEDDEAGTEQAQAA